MAPLRPPHSLAWDWQTESSLARPAPSRPCTSRSSFIANAAPLPPSAARRNLLRMPWLTRLLDRCSGTTLPLASIAIPASTRRIRAPKLVSAPTRATTSLRAERPVATRALRGATTITPVLLSANSGEFEPPTHAYSARTTPSLVGRACFRVCMHALNRMEVVGSGRACCLRGALRRIRAAAWGHTHVPS